MAEYDVESEFSGLLVRVSAEDVSGDNAGKIYLIPKSSLGAFEFNPANLVAFNNTLQGKFLHLEYAIYREDLILRASTH